MPGKNTARKKNQQRFSQLPSVSIARSSFARSCGMRTTMDSGFLYPVFCDEVLPGDTFKLSPTVFARLATPLHPVMDNMYLDIQFFFIPNRLVWENWERFQGAQDNPGDSTDFLIPQVVTNSFGWTPETIGDYFGLPTSVPDVTANALPFRAFYLTYNEWYRSEDLQDALPVLKDDGPDLFTTYISDYGETGVFNGLPKRGKRHDYFTSCLPFAQKGPDVQLPLGVTAPTNLGTSGVVNVTGTGDPTFDLDNGVGLTLGIPAPSSQNAQWSAAVGGADASATWNNPNLQADISGQTWITDLSTATSSSINELREAITLQHMFERDARGGTRYTEILRNRFGVVSPDQRLQRPQYLGGGSTKLNVQPIPQTSETNTSPQGNLAAYVTALGQRGGWQKSFVEHGHVIGIASLRADLNYQQGIERMWSRRTRYDFFSPELAHLGEQAVLSKEIYYDGTASDDDVFGYNERWSEYKYKPSRVTGVFRSNHPQSLDTWHLAQDFATRPLLNADFIKENPPIDRAIAVPSEPELLLDIDFQYVCVRPMPVYSTPGLTRF